jgi:serine protease Do
MAAPITTVLRLRKFFKTGILGTLAVLAGSLFSGCATVQSNPKSNLNLTEYRKIFFTPVDEEGDPRIVLPRVVERLRAIGFEVYLPKQGEPIASQGSGLIVDEQGHVLTCAHVLGVNTNATLWIGSRRLDAAVVKVDTNSDMALLKVSSGGNIFTPLVFAAEKNLSMGQDVFTMGFPLSDVLGNSPRLTKGLVSSTVGMADNPDYLQVSAEVQSGNSGGPLLNARAEVIGLITSTLNPLNVLLRTGAALPQNVNFAAKSQVVRGFLSQAGIQPKIASTGESPRSFDGVKESIALVRAGVVPTEGAKVKEMLCTIKYVYFWDMWYRFKVFQLDFNDLKNGELILRVGQYGDKVFTGEDAVIDRVIAEVRSKFYANEALPAVKVATPPATGRR